jgi:leucyl/phenylalanyl-tRNA--protein transferase
MTPLSPEQLLRAYASGVFPMARFRSDERLYWVDPERRGILPLDRFHLPRSLKKTIRQGCFAVTSDTAFEATLRLCAEPTADRPDTWINEEIIRLFLELHHLGLAHSVESWLEGELSGGLYGLSLGSAFFGESMFTRTTDASKVALAYLVAGLKKGGYTLLDTQFVTAHLAQFGAVEIARRDYLRRLADALGRTATFYRALTGDDVLAALSSQE